MIGEYLKRYKEEIKRCINDLKHKDTFYKQIPNLLTFSRAVGMIPVNILFFAGNNVLAIILTCLLLSTDFFDGRIAREYNIQSEFGADLDAVCDKIMFLGLSLPLIISNPILLVNLILEGIISYINVLGRMEGLNTKTVMAGKIKTWFLSGSLLAGYLVKIFGIPSLVLQILASMTICSQAISIDCYLKEYKNMKDYKLLEKSNDSENISKEDNHTNDKTLVEELKREKEFLLGFKEPEKEIDVLTKKRKKEDTY